MIESPQTEPIAKNPKQIAIDNQLELRKLTGGDHTPPGEHYLHAMYLWDTCFHSIVYAKGGRSDLACDEIKKLLAGQITTPGKWDGFIANMLSFKEGKRLIDPEVWFRNHPEHSDYSQPPIIALAVKRAYESVKETDPTGANKFLAEVYPALVKYYGYFRSNRENKDSHLIGIVHPSETGRDSDPDLGEAPLRIKADYNVKNYTDISSVNPRLKATGIANALLDYAGKVIGHDARNWKDHWDPELIRERYWVNDVMFNAMYVENLRILSDMAGILGDNFKEKSGIEEKPGVRKESTKQYKNEQEIFKRWAHQTKEDMDRFMKGEDNIYHNLNNEGKNKIKNRKIEQMSVSNLFSLILGDVDKNSLKSILALLEDETKFNTPFSIPSLPADDPKYDPHGIEKRLWRGPVWMNMNWYLAVDGLLKQAKIYHTSDPEISKECLERARHIAGKSLELVQKEGTWEYYDPVNGKGYRVHPFGWSNLGFILPSEVKEVEAELSK